MLAAPLANFLATLLATVLLLSLPIDASRAETPILPVDQVTRGMKGVGYTVFQGDTIEQFGVEILSVMKRTRAQGDLILFRAEGEKLEHTGIIAGMSGSPVYIDGKLIGAVAFAYSGAKDPIGAITPIQEMLDILDNGLEHSTRDNATGLDVEPWRLEPEERSTENFAGAPALFEESLARLTRRPVEPGSRTSAGRGASQRSPAELSPVLVPIALDGWDEGMRATMAEDLSRLGLSGVSSPSGSVAAGAVGSVDQKAPPLTPGSALGIQFVRGDADLTAIGTVTWVDGDRILAFGHPMVQAGAVSFPMSAAWIHDVIPTLAVSVKMGASRGPLGGIYQDRRAGIAGRMGAQPDLLPVRVTLQNERGETRDFNYEVARHPGLTPTFIPWTISNSLLAAGWSSGDASLQTETTVFHSGGEQLTRRERITTPAPGSGVGLDVALPATLLMVNPFERVRIDSVAVWMAYEAGNATARLTELSCERTRAEVGDTLHLSMRIEPYRAPVETRVLHVVIPTAWAGKSLRILCGGAEDFSEWDRDRAPEKFEPHSLRQLETLIREAPDESILSLRVYSTEPGALVRGVEVSGLPPSLASAAVTTSGRGGVTTSVNGRLLEEKRYETPYVLKGGEQIEVEVAE